MNIYCDSIEQNSFRTKTLTNYGVKNHIEVTVTFVTFKGLLLKSHICLCEKEKDKEKEVDYLID